MLFMLPFGRKFYERGIKGYCTRKAELYVDKDLVLYRTGFILDDMGLIHQDLALTTSHLCHQRD
jgi:hypothetical protein